jgi:response regulator RpfG family c-di-GMP phosphodiesterase
VTVPARTSVVIANKRTADRLLADGVLTAEQHNAVLEHMNRSGDRAEEAVLELGFVQEADLLKSLATAHKTHFVSTEKLAKADIPKSTLDMVPRKLAEVRGICPVIFDQKSSTLSVATADPDNLEALREAQIASGARDVKAIVARPAAVKALIAKAYGGDIHAFALLDRQAHAQFQTMLNVYERNLVSDESMATSLAKESTIKRERAFSEKELERNASGASGGASSQQMLELMNVMVSLLEATRPELRGHSAQVARLVKQLAERMSLDAVTVAAITAAAYVHDLGKMGQYHLTSLNSSEYDGHKQAAQKAAVTPARLLEPAHLSRDTTDSLDHMYERYDGKGFPEGLGGKDIPIGARILAICDTYADLTESVRNPFRKKLSPTDANAVLAKYKGTIFDPNLVDLFKHTVTGDNLRDRLLANRYNALVVDADPEETTVVELRMIEQGFVVKIARTAEQALKELAGGEIDLVVSEIDLGDGDGLKLLAEARKQAWGKELPWVIYARKQERAAAQKAFELGVLDFVAKPAAADVLVAKLKAMLDQRTTQKGKRGVSGSLREMGLAEMIQVLTTGRKSGNLRIQSRGEKGEIHLLEGAVVNALWGELRGENAFYEMMRLTEGDFGLDPAFKPQARVISQTTDSLLLEAMRRLDEGITE